MSVHMSAFYNFIFIFALNRIRKFVIQLAEWPQEKTKNWKIYYSIRI